jgi:hypothetical protein
VLQRFRAETIQHLGLFACAELSQLCSLEPGSASSLLEAGDGADGNQKHTGTGSSKITQALLPATMLLPTASTALAPT